MDRSLHFKIFLRLLDKNKLFYVINVAGLIVGITIGLFIFLYIHNELSYDKFNVHAAQLYRIGLESYGEGTLLEKDAMTYSALGPAVKRNLSEVKDYIRLKGENGLIGRKGENIQFREFKIFYTDNSFFSMFSFPLIKGDPNTALLLPNSAVITRSAEKKYFGSGDAMGKTLIFDGKDNFNITGVIDDIPENSHMRLDFLFSFNSLYQHYSKDSVENSWQWNEFYTYVQLNPGVNVKQFQQKMNAVANTGKAHVLELKGKKETLFLQPLTDIHVHSNLLHEIKPSANAEIIYFLLISGIIILVIAWINYINLTSIKAFERAKEVGVQKVLGAGKARLVMQFLAESAMVNLLAVIISILLIWLLSPVLFNFLNASLFQGSPFYQPFFWSMIAAVFAGGVIITGIYPALLMASFKPSSVLKGKLKKSSRDTFMRESLVIFQFLITMVLIGSTIVIYRQMSFMLNVDKGINIEKMLAIASPRVFSNDSSVNYKSLFESFKNDLKQDKDVMEVSYSTLVPSKENYWIEPVQLSGQSNLAQQDIEMAAVDYDFQAAFNVQMKSGRFFSKDFKADEVAVIVNEAALSYLSIGSAEEALKQKILLFDVPRQIIGVMSNYHNLSLKNNFSPTIYILRYVPRSYISVKVNSPDAYNRVIDYCSNKWNSFFPGNAFEYFLVKDSYQMQYSEEDRFRKILSLATLLAIVIACLGLFGLTLYESVLRRKEIGIRRTLGASTYDIVKLLSFKSLKILLIVFVIAIPVIHFMMGQWLANYVMHISLNGWIYLTAILSVTIITLTTTVWQSVRAAHHNPVQSLRQE